ncbi:MAG: hypothetical protein ACQR33_00130 [Candidatus Saccharibacteria bacterium]
MNANSHDHPDYIKALKAHYGAVGELEHYLVRRSAAANTSTGHMLNPVLTTLERNVTETKRRLDELHEHYFGR